MAINHKRKDYRLIISIVALSIMCLFQQKEDVFMVFTIILVYLRIAFIILRNFRFIRLKEVETILAACFKHKDIL